MDVSRKKRDERRSAGSAARLGVAGEVMGRGVQDVSIAGDDRGGIAVRVPPILSDIEGLAEAANGGDAGAGHQRKGKPMSERQNGNGPAQGSKDPVGPRDTIFDQPAPAGAAKKTSEVLGEIVWLMSQSSLHKQFFISDLEWLAMTPMLLQQFRLFYDKDKPVGVLFWGTVSQEVEARLAAGTSRMRPQDWKSGDRLWVVEVIAPFGGADEMVKDLKAKVFAGREMKVLAVGAKGREVRVV